jgi:hypothetical protein
MNVVTRTILGVFLASSLGCVVALVAGASWWRWVSAPALVLSGLVAIGHLVTLDDDAAGGWSSPAHPKEAKAFWRRSLVELAAKVAVFGGLAWFVATDWSR